MTSRVVGFAVALAMLGAACTGAPTSTLLPTASGSPGPTVGPLPTPADHDLAVAELKYRLLDTFAPLTYCDPDEYPIAHGDETQKAIERFPEIASDSSTLAAIVERLGLAGTTTFTADQKLAIYRQWKQLNAIALTSAAGGRQSFDLVTETDPGLGQGVLSKGTIDTRGAIVVESTEAAFLVGCPICLARGTRIATPLGEIPVEALRVGDPVWTLDATGRRVAVTVAALGRAAVPAWHEVVHLVLADGRELWASAGHPLADGRPLGTLKAGDHVDGARIVSADAVAYGLPFTYDLLPSGPSGLYWANGILLGSTLRR
jgi:hypothetical protein